MFDARVIRADFPLLRRRIGGKPIVYLDSTATTLKPQAVIDKENDYYTKYTANVFRGIYSISEKATSEYEKSRAKIAAFIGADSREVVFTRSTTESVNLVAYSWAKNNLKPGDEVVTSIMEHHSNFVPWQQLAEQIGFKVSVWNVSPEGELNLDDLDKLITRRTKLLGVTAVSNVLGTINPIDDVVRKVRRLNPQCLVLVDAAQAVPHLPVDVYKWGADFVAFSSHKMLGPTGVGVLWAKRQLLEAMPPFNFGGDMIKEVHLKQTIFNEVPHKFEAGTPHIAGVIGLGAAVDYLAKLGMENIREHEQEITDYALRKLDQVSGIAVYGPHEARKRGGVIAFRLAGIHPHDVAQILDEDNVCVRVGYHCAQPLHEYLKIGPTVRVSFYVYTTREDIDALIEGLQKVKKVFS